eukprot:3437710-Amphidinium_carterae.3
MIGLSVTHPLVACDLWQAQPVTTTPEIERVAYGPDHMYRLWLQGFAATVLVEFIQGLRHIAGNVERWSLCAGCGFASHTLQALGRVLKSEYGIEMGFHTTLLCEKDSSKQEWLAHQFQPDWLVADMAELDAESAVNLMDKSHKLGKRKTLPYVGLLDAGFPCTSRTHSAHQGLPICTACKLSRARPVLATTWCRRQYGVMVQTFWSWSVSTLNQTSTSQSSSAPKAKASPVSDTDYILHDLRAELGLPTL